jgi:hypothetical protein
MKIASIWSAFESAPGIARAVIDWKAILCPHFETVKTYLKPVHGLASSVPCRTKPECGCDHAVVEHKRDDLVSVCQCDPKRCDTAPLDRADAVVCELNLPALGGAIANAMGAKPDDQGIDGLESTRQVGIYSPQSGVSIPLILTVQSTPEDLQRVAERLLAKDDRPFVLLSPTDKHWKLDCDRLLRAKKAAFVPLSETITWNGTLSSKQNLGDLIPETVAAILPSSKEKCVLRKDGATWTVVFQDVTKTVRHSKGVAYIAHLLRNPGQDIFVSILRAAAVGDDGSMVLGSAGTTLDQQAINAYKEKIENMEEELQSATGDRKATLLEDRATLFAEIGRATGLGGRQRHQRDDLERARQSVSRVIHTALKAIKPIHPTFHQHLENAVKIGIVLSYRPGESLVWAAE